MRAAMSLGGLFGGLTEGSRAPAVEFHTLLRVLEQDLRALSEVRDARKFPEVREAAERALLKLRVVSKGLPEHASPAVQSAAIAAEEEILVPFMLALASKSDSLPLSALGAVGRMISHHAVSPQRLPTVVSQLTARAQTPSADESSLLKVLQTVLTIASSPALLQLDATISQLLVLCLTLQQSRSATIKNTASATVQQFVALLLDAVAAEGGRSGARHDDDDGAEHAKPSLASLSVAARCSYLAVADLCLLANGQPPQWLPSTGPVHVPFALDVLCRTLQSHKSLFLSSASLRYLLRDRCCALVLKTMQQPSQEWGVALRLSHLTSILLSGYAPVLRTEAEILLSMLAKTAASETVHTWQRALALEACRVVASDPILLRTFFEAYDMNPASSDVFGTFASSICGLLRSNAIGFQSHAEYIEPHFLHHHRASSSGRTPSFNISLYSETDGSQITNDYTAALAIECQIFIARAIGTITEPLRPPLDGEVVDTPAAAEAAAAAAAALAASPSSRLSHISLAAENATREAETALVREMVNVCWRPLLGGLTLLMARFTSEESIQAVLKCYQAFTQACGALSLTVPRDAYLGSLCNYALPPRPRNVSEGGATVSLAPDTSYEPLPYTSLSAKNVQALKAVFNIAHCMGGLLGASWNLILSTLEQLDRIIFSSKTTATFKAAELATATGGPDATSNELNILSAALTNLFSGSVRLDDEAIGAFLTALSTQCFASLAHEATSKEKLATPGSAAALQPRLFALTKFVETAMINLHRIQSLWPLVTQFLLPIANHQTQRIRVLGMESLSKLIIAAMQQSLKPPTAAADGEAGPPAALATPDGAAWDRALLAPLEELQRRCAHRETQERILRSMHEVLQACGAGLTDGWLLLLSILWRAATKPSLVPLLPMAFRSVQLIASDFLPHLPPACLPAYVEVAAAFATQQSQLNVALTAVGLQWTIGDYLYTEYSKSEHARAAEAALAERSSSAEADELDREEEAAIAREAEDAKVHAEDERALRRLRSVSVNAAEDAEAEAIGEEAAGTAHASAARYGEVELGLPVRTHAVWCAIMRQLRRLCVDSRTEVRTCSLHSLESIVSSHGASLSGSSWDHIVHRTLLPLLTEMTVKAASASNEEVAKPLGTEGGRTVLMLLHHSRDTASKQWDETWVLSLNLITRLFRAFLPEIQTRRNFPAAWHSLLGFLEASLLNSPRSTEVAVAAIGASHALMLSAAHRRSSSGALLAGAGGNFGGGELGRDDGSVPATPPRAMPLADVPSGGLHTAGALHVERERLPPPLWASVWALLERAVETATADGASFATHERMLCKLVKQFTELYEGGREHFEEADVLRLLQMAEKLGRHPDGASHGWDPTAAAAAPTQLQTAVLGLLEVLPPFAPTVRANEMWPLVLWLLLKFVEPPAASPPPLPAAAAAAAGAGAAGGSKPKVGFAERALELLHSLLTTRAEPAAKLAVVEDVLHVLRRVVSWRGHPACACPSLPRAAASGFPALLDALLPHLSLLDDDAARRAHAELVEALWMLLSPPATCPQPSAAGKRDGAAPPVAQPLAVGGDDAPMPLLLGGGDDEARALEAATVGAVRRVLGSTPMRSAPRKRLLQVLVAVATADDASAVARDACWREAVEGLCNLCDAGAEGGGVGCASLAAPMLLQAASQVLSGWCSPSTERLGPILGARAAQLSHLLTLLTELTLPRKLSSGGGGGGSRGDRSPASPPAEPAGLGPRGHLKRLAPMIIDCVGAPACAFGGGPMPPEVAALQGCLRRALHAAVAEFELE